MVKINNLCVSYASNKVYENFDLEMDDGEVTCILGESGCGKTTLLNAIAGLIKYSGTISPVTVSYVFQSARLVPNLTVLKNLTLIGADESAAKNMLKRVGLDDKCNRYPSSLSGGEAQRVSLSRAFLYPSDILLMDEPFSSLDLKTKFSVMELFNTLRNEEGKGALFVTHDVDEALYLADEIMILQKGKIIAKFDNNDKGEFGAGSPLREQIINLLVK